MAYHRDIRRTYALENILNNAFVNSNIPNTSVVPVRDIVRLCNGNPTTQELIIYAVYDLCNRNITGYSHINEEFGGTLVDIDGDMRADDMFGEPSLYQCIMTRLSTVDKLGPWLSERMCLAGYFRYIIEIRHNCVHIFPEDFESCLKNIRKWCTPGSDITRMESLDQLVNEAAQLLAEAYECGSAFSKDTVIRGLNNARTAIVLESNWWSDALFDIASIAVREAKCDYIELISWAKMVAEHLSKFFDDQQSSFDAMENASDNSAWKDEELAVILWDRGVLDRCITGALQETSHMTRVNGDHKPLVNNPTTSKQMKCIDIVTILNDILFLLDPSMDCDDSGDIQWIGE